MIRFLHDERASGPVDSTPPAEMRRSGLLHMLWRHKWLVGLCALVGLAGAVGYMYQATPMYRSTARVYVERVGPRIIAADDAVVSQSRNYLYTQAEMIKSGPILEQALQSELLPVKGGLTDSPTALADLAGQVKVEVGARDEIINVTVDSPAPAEAALLANTIVDAYIRYQSANKHSTAAEVLRILTTEKAKADSELAGRLKEMMDFRKAHGEVAMVTDEARGGLGEALVSLTTAMTTAKLKAIDAKATCDAIEAVAADTTRARQYAQAKRMQNATLSSGGEAGRLINELNQLKIKLMDLRGERTEEHPAVVNLKARIVALEEQLVQLDQALLQSELELARKEYQTYHQRQEQIAQYFQAERLRAQGFNSLQTQYIMLRNEWQQTQKLVDMLDERIRQVNVTDEAGAMNISIVEPAKASAAPASPQPAKTAALGALLGLALGCVLALLWEAVDGRIRSSHEVAAHLGLPVVGVVPQMSKGPGAYSRGQRARGESDSPAGEAYRNIRTSLCFGSPDGLARRIVVTSAAPGDGKSTLVSNLGIAMALSEQKTLIIDADFRRPTQHRIFNLDGAQGVTSVLMGACSLQSALAHTDVENLDVLACGPVPRSPSEMLHSKGFAQLLQTLATQYDCILIDSPPVLPASDARILAALCGQVLLVLRAQRSRHDQTRMARDVLASVGANIIGTVVNAASPRRHNGYGYYGMCYSSRYSYGRVGEHEPAMPEEKTAGRPAAQDATRGQYISSS